VDAGGYVSRETRQTRRDARADLKLAKRLETMPVLQAGMTEGVVSTAQARVIVHAIDALPSSGEFAVSEEQRAEAEVHLVQQAATYDAVTLAVLGQRIFEVISPAAAEAYEGKKLEAEEAKAARKTTFSMWVDDQGVAHGKFRVPALQPGHRRPRDRAPSQTAGVPGRPHPGRPGAQVSGPRRGSEGPVPHRADAPRDGSA
jgi:hypothetical protein